MTDERKFAFTTTFHTSVFILSPVSNQKVNLHARHISEKDKKHSEAANIHLNQELCRMEEMQQFESEEVCSRERLEEEWLKRFKILNNCVSNMNRNNLRSRGSSDLDFADPQIKTENLIADLRKEIAEFEKNTAEIFEFHKTLQAEASKDEFEIMKDLGELFIEEYTSAASAMERTYMKERNEYVFRRISALQSTGGLQKGVLQDLKSTHNKLRAVYDERLGVLGDMLDVFILANKTNVVLQLERAKTGAKPALQGKKPKDVCDALLAGRRIEELQTEQTAMSVQLEACDVKIEDLEKLLSDQKLDKDGLADENRKLKKSVESVENERDEVKELHMILMQDHEELNQRFLQYREERMEIEKNWCIASCTVGAVVLIIAMIALLVLRWRRKRKRSRKKKNQLRGGKERSVGTEDESDAV